MTISAPSALRFREADIGDDLGLAPLRGPIPSKAWLYGVLSNTLSFAGFEAGVWIRLLVRVTGAKTGFSIIAEDGSTSFAPEEVIEPSDAVHTVILRPRAEAETGLVLFRNWDDEGQSGWVEVLEAEFIDGSTAKGRLLAATLPVFDATWYAGQHPDIDTARHDALAHYLALGAAEGADPNAFINGEWYKRRHPEAAGGGDPAVVHYLSEGAAQGLDPSPAFATAWYRDQHAAALARLGVSPLEHFIRIGRRAGESPTPFEPDVLLLDLLEQQELESATRWFSYLTALPDAGPTPSTILQLGELLRYAAERGLVMHPQGISPPTTQGRASEAGPPRYVADLRDVVVQGGGMLVLPTEEIALHDELWYTEEHFPTDTKSAHIARLTDRRVMVRAPDAFTPKIASGIHLMNEADANYYHWVVEVLPRLFLMQEQGLLHALPEDMPFLVTEGLDDRLPELLGYLDADERPVVKLKRDGLYRLDRVVYPGATTRVLNNYYRAPSAVNTFVPTDLLGPMAREIKSRLDLRRLDRGRRVYIHRGGANRVLATQPELQEKLIDVGFEVVDPVGLSARAQIALFHQCEHIIAPTGAACTNILWCQPGTRVSVLYPEHNASNPGVWQPLADASGSRIDHIRCPRSYDVIGRFSVHDSYIFPMEWLPRLF